MQQRKVFISNSQKWLRKLERDTDTKINALDMLHYAQSLHSCVHFTKRYAIPKASGNITGSLFTARKPKTWRHDQQNTKPLGHTQRKKCILQGVLSWEANCLEEPSGKTWTSETLDQTKQCDKECLTNDYIIITLLQAVRLCRTTKTVSVKRLPKQQASRGYQNSPRQEATKTVSVKRPLGRDQTQLWPNSTSSVNMVA